MPLWKCRKAVQKIVIPRGMIDPNETTVIEIPADLKKYPVVVAKKAIVDKTLTLSSKRLRDSCNKSESLTSSSRRNTTLSTCFVRSIESLDEPEAVSSEDDDLADTEEQERLELENTLQEFQSARRKLVFNASKLARGNNSGRSILQASTLSSTNKSGTRRSLRRNRNEDEDEDDYNDDEGY